MLQTEDVFAGRTGRGTVDGRRTVIPRLPGGWAAILPPALVFAGCSPTVADVARPPDLKGSIAFDYVDVAEPGFVDQTLTIVNSADVPVVLEADLEALDATGQVLPDVDISGVYGTDRGGQVLLPGENVDFLVFTGDGAAKVYDVRATNVRPRATGFPAVSLLVEAVPLDGSGKELDYPAGFSSVELRNPNQEQVTVGVVCIIWDQPPPGQSQQALAVLTLSPATPVPAGGEFELEVSSDDRRTIERFAATNAISLKAYFASS